ncbi:MAG: diaminopimelate epimerase [Alphaproteobacteria bacterium PRO2]|nr:diaminopimelate epimerase [Alphaproteobacteria bacterium PRO2]
MRFIKMHGLGNDFVILDFRDGSTPIGRAQMEKIANRKTGIGCDQLIILQPKKNPESALFMAIYNQDGSEAEACGNATRCVASLIMNETGKDMTVIETVAGMLPCWREPDGRITADMGEPKFGWKDVPLAKEIDTLHLGIGEGNVKDPVGVNVGNPHAVFFVDNVEKLDVSKIGPRFESDELFPSKTNVEFVEVRSPKELRMRVWERNAGETHACGSGACATLVAAVRRGLADRKADIVLDGGTLSIHWRDDNHVLMTGAAAYVFDGTLK